MKTLKNFFSVLLVVVLILAGFFGIGRFGSLIDSEGGSSLERDTNMDTKRYQAEIVIGEDMTYTVTETWDVDMLTERHGIYRYLTQKGEFLDTVQDRTVPYNAQIKVLECSAPISKETDGKYKLLKLGDEDETVFGEVTYNLKYTWTPRFREKDQDFSLVYYNLTPFSWQNEIPAGSSISVTFPKEVDADGVKLYYGNYGSTEDADSLLDVSWDGNTMTAELLRNLELGSGITLWADMGEGYFSGLHEMSGGGLVLGISIAVLVLAALLFLVFGRDAEIIPSVQFEPPVDLDSATAGYIVDGSADARDVISLILYWADRGYLTIEQTKKDIFLQKTALPLPDDVPGYQKTFYNRLFKKKDRVGIKSLKYKCSKAMETSKSQIKDYITAKGGLYTGSSKAARAVSWVISLIPAVALIVNLSTTPADGGAMSFVNFFALLVLAVGSILFSLTVDRWHGLSGNNRAAWGILSFGMTLFGAAIILGSWFWTRESSFVAAVPVLGAVACVEITVFLAAFMKKRTAVCVEWMGRLLGLRDFIETAELDRMKALAEENPQWFYHVLPYTYVFGISDVFAKKLEDLAIPQPEWYVGPDPYFNYYMFSHQMMHTMDDIRETLTIADPSSGGSGSGGGGGFSGGGGFAGGGGGGGGGGSW